MMKPFLFLPFHDSTYWLAPRRMAGIPPASLMFCRPCGALVRAFAPSQIRARFRIALRSRFFPVCSLCGWMYFREEIEPALRRKVFDADNRECVYCSADGMFFDLTIDHVKPGILGGRNEFSNLVTCCARCNSSKGSGKPMPMRYGRFRAIAIQEVAE